MMSQTQKINPFSYLLLASLTLLIQTSCLKAPELNQDIGPAVPFENVSETLLKAWGDPDPNTIEKNNFVSIDRTQKILDVSGENTVFQVGFTVIDKKESEDKDSYIYDILQQTNEINNGQSKLSSLLRSISVVKSEATKITSLSTKEEFKPLASLNLQPLSIEVFASYLNACSPDKANTITCHNLVETDEIEDPPKKVKEAPNCSGIPNCKIHVKTISFDRQIKRSNQDNTSNQTERLNFKIRISPDVPFLARVIESCFRGMVQVPNSTQRVLVTLCDRVQDFK